MTEGSSMQLTDEQARIMAVCAMCQAPLERDQVKAALESGTQPMEMVCSACGENEAGHIQGLMRMWSLIAAQKIVERIERAGLMEHYKGVAADTLLRQQNRQN